MESFDQDLEMIKISKDEWRKLIFLRAKTKRIHQKYSLRLVINHNPRKQLKSKSYLDEIWNLIPSEVGEGGTNINFTLESDQLVEFTFNEKNLSLKCRTLSSENKLIPVLENNSYQLNGFIWDDPNMFEKFDPKLGARSFKHISDDLWTIDVPLRKNGGIDFRADGVYQFLISADFDEDFGFSALNDGEGSLIKNCGFSSSHGTSMNSAPTVRINETGLYRFSLHSPKHNPRVSVSQIKANTNHSSSSNLSLLNNIASVQLLGSIYDNDQFNPQNKEREMINIPNTLKYEKITHVKSGEHSVNFALSSELFLDTMGLGCWLDVGINENSQKLLGVDGTESLKIQYKL